MKTWSYAVVTKEAERRITDLMNPITPAVRIGRGGATAPLGLCVCTSYGTVSPLAGATMAMGERMEARRSLAANDNEKIGKVGKIFHDAGRVFQPRLKIAAAGSAIFQREVGDRINC